MMSREFEKCLEREKIKKFPRAKRLVFKEINLAEEDLKTARESFRKKNYKWSTIQSYYSMFHTARSLLYKKGYREKSHFCLIEAVKNFYVINGVLSENFIDVLKLGKSLRENADYYGDFDKNGAKEMLESAGDFIKETKNILRKRTLFS